MCTAGLAEQLLQLGTAASRHLGNASSHWAGRSPQQSTSEAAPSSVAQCRRALSSMFLVAVSARDIFLGSAHSLCSGALRNCHWQQTQFFVYYFFAVSITKSASVQLAKGNASWKADECICPWCLYLSHPLPYSVGSSVMDDIALLRASLFPRADPVAGEEAAFHPGELEAQCPGRTYIPAINLNGFSPPCWGMQAVLSYVAWKAMQCWKGIWRYVGK